MNSSLRYDFLQLAASLSDLKHEHYETVLTLSAIVELLMDKGMITEEELHAKTTQMDQHLEQIISASLHPTT